MTRRPRPVRLAALLLVGLAAKSAAQDPAPVRDQNMACAPRTSRAARPCEPAKTVVILETEATFTLEQPEARSLQCAATVEIVYTQRDRVARVEGTIDHEACGASDGEHRLTVNVRDQKSEVQSFAFVHAWRRDDDQPVSFEADYPIPENVDLLSVRARQLRCTCAAGPPPASTAEDSLQGERP